MNVKNLNGSSRFPKPSCGCSSWIDHWDNNSGCKRPNKCPGCQKPLTRNNTVGAHVIKVNSPDKDRYITPLCDECNHKKDIRVIFYNQYYKMDNYYHLILPLYLLYYIH